MSVEDGARDQRWRAPSLPKDPTALSTVALAVGLAVVAATWWVAAAVRGAMADAQVSSALVDGALLIGGIASLLLLLPAIAGVRSARRAWAARSASNIVAARVESAAAQTWCWFTFGYAATVVVILLIALFIIANDAAVGRTFFYLPLMRDSFWLVLKAFWINVYIAVVAEALVLVWGLVVALARLLPGRPGQPIRMMATAYTDVFRGLPAIITLYLVGFGLPLTGIPFTRHLPLTALAIIALTLTYGAYVAEVYRSGIASIHWSQTAAARSLGLSFLQSLRFVVVPQAVRRIVPPLLNDFIGLQKDTALVAIIGVIDAFNQAKIIASNHFNLSAVTTVGILFVLVTIPQARFVDRLLEREQRRTQAGG
ncbi:MAG TPA: amino acid ABC transporter permease [Candidatus Angelobacter sp.]|nr:amino acid ABC transporter permease [Candidatus Angelobacter sp.]